MCLISCLPKGTSKNIAIIEEFIENGMKSNPHGSGFAYKKHGTNEIYLSKGYTSVQSIVDDIEKCHLKEEDELIIHHRIGTSGEQTSLNTHPFLVTTDEATISQIQGTFNLPVMAHNGIMSEFADYNSKYNDTLLFVKDFLAIPEILKQLTEDPTKFQKNYRGIIERQRLAFLFPDTPMMLIGNFTEDEGYYHSNGGYKSFVFDRGGSSHNKRNNKTEVRNFNLLNRGKTIKDQTFIESLEDQYAVEGSEDNDLNCGIGYSRSIVPFKSELEWPYATGLNNKESTLLDPKILTQDKKIITNNLKFSGKSFCINEKNFKHVILMPIIDIKASTMNGSGILKANKGYEFESFDKLAYLNWVVETSGDHEMYYIDYSKAMDYVNIFIKHEFRDKYNDLSKFIGNNNIIFTKSMMKKVAKVISVNSKREQFHFKGYGYFFKDNLQHLLNLNTALISFSQQEKREMQFADAADELVRKSIKWSDKDSSELVVNPEDISS